MASKTAAANTTTDTTETQGSTFGIVTQYVKDQSFENPNPVDAFLTQHEVQPN
jgi:preprotein translocase subunit SecB